MLPVALEAAKSDDLTTKAISKVAQAAQTHMTIEKFDALVIHEGEMGGWLVDLLLRDMPPGVPTVLGTPVQHPYRTRQEAQNTALDLLIGIVKLVQTNTQPPAPPTFEFYDCDFPIRPEAIEMLFASGFAESDYTSAHALERLREIDVQLFPNGFTLDRYDHLSEDARLRLVAVFHMAAARGIFRFPPPEAKPPKS